MSSGSPVVCRSFAVSRHVGLVALALTALSVVACDLRAAVYSSAYTPGTAGTPGSLGTPGTPAAAGTLLQALTPSAIGSGSGTWRRPTGSASEINPAPSVTLAGGSFDFYYYSAVAFTVPSSGTVDYLQAASFDGFLHIYAGGFNPASPFANLLGGDDDMLSLLGGTLPTMAATGGWGVTPSASGLRFQATAGVTYTAVASTYATSATLPAAGGRLAAEVRTAGFDGSPGSAGAPPSAGVQGSPARGIADFVPGQAPVATTLILNVTDHGQIASFNRLNLIDVVHTFVGDLVVTLGHGAVTVTILNRQGSGGDWLAGLTYAFADSGLAYPNTDALGNVSYRPQGLLSAFAGMDVFGDWVLTITDMATSDIGSISAFGIDVSLVTQIPGDYNGDGYVDAADYTVWADHFGQSGAGVAGDGNGDGIVDAADYTIWADHFGQGTPPGMLGGSVPEPGIGMTLAGIAALAGMRRRRHRS